MKRSQLISLLTAGFLASALILALNSASAQNGPARVAHHVQMLTKVLSLSSAQQQQATTIFTNAAASEQTLHASMKTAHESLKQAIAANNSSAIDQNATSIGNLTTQMVSTRAKAQAAF